MTRVALFSSGNGTNAENIVNYFKNSTQIKIVVVISNNQDAFVHKRAKKLGVPSHTFNKAEMMEADKVLELLNHYGVDYIVLAGYLLKIPKPLLSRYPNRIINIHPALLPKYGGKGMYGDNVHKKVVEMGEKVSGITIHYVNEHYDKGKIIFQASCEVTSDDTYEDVAQKVHKLEYAHFPRVIEEVILRQKESV